MSPITTSKDLYAILELDRSATAAQIKAAYRKLALLNHPDKQKEGDKEEATERFQQIGLAYAVLSDASKKAHYDRTGSVGEGFLEDKDWTDYFKELWTGVVNDETIVAQAQKYRESDEERADVLKYYKQFKGDMNQILEHVECSTASDGPRFLALIQEAIKTDTLPKYKALETTTTKKEHTKRVQKEKREAKRFEAEENQPQEQDNQASLQQLIMARSASRKQALDSMFASFVEKEAKPKKRKADKKEEEPSEEEFQKIQAKLMKRKKT